MRRKKQIKTFRIYFYLVMAACLVSFDVSAHSGGGFEGTWNSDGTLSSDAATFSHTAPPGYSRCQTLLRVSARSVDADCQAKTPPDTDRTSDCNVSAAQAKIRAEINETYQGYYSDNSVATESQIRTIVNKHVSISQYTDCVSFSGEHVHYFPDTGEAIYVTTGSVQTSYSDCYDVETKVKTEGAITITKRIDANENGFFDDHETDTEQVPGVDRVKRLKTLTDSELRKYASCTGTTVSELSDIIAGTSTTLPPLPSERAQPRSAPQQFSTEDVNRDEVIDNKNLTGIANNMGLTPKGTLLPYDVDGDGDIDTDDYQQVLNACNACAGSAPAARQLHQPELVVPRPKTTPLLPNYPNPFNPETWIPYRLADDAEVVVTIYAVNGDVVRRLELGHQNAGVYRHRAKAAYWDGRDGLGFPVSSGIYFYTLSAGDFSATRKMLIAK